MKLESAFDWSFDEFAKAFPDIIRCFRTYCDRFPHHGTPWSMVEDAMSGRRNLWVVRDDAGQIIITFLTTIEDVRGTDIRRFVMCSLGGERLGEAMAVYPELETWAREQGCNEFTLLGRKGWRRMLEPYGLTPDATIYTKRD